jgi:hypothetical protein
MLIEPSAALLLSRTAATRRHLVSGTAQIRIHVAANARMFGANGGLLQRGQTDRGRRVSRRQAGNSTGQISAAIVMAAKLAAIGR